MKQPIQWKTIAVDQAYNLAAGFLYAAAISYFAGGADFAPGGVSGLALIASHLWGLRLGAVTVALNILLALGSVFFVGRQFLIKSMVSTLYCALFQDVIFARLPTYGGDPLLAALFTGILWGVAIALLYMRGSSSGGTDFLTVSINTRRPHLSVGVITGVIDVAVILIGWPVFGSIDSVLYGLVTTVLTSFTIDRIMAQSSSSKMLTIITTRGQYIADWIGRNCDRGSTLVKATGTFTGTERQILLCACSRLQVYGIRAAAYAIDPSCMVMISETSEVYGEGFSDPSRKNAFS